MFKLVKKPVALIAITAVSIIAALGVGASAAKAATCVSTTWGGSEASITGLGTGSTMSVNFTASNIVYNSGSFRIQAQMTDTVGNTYKLGIVRQSNGALSSFIEKNGTFFETTNVAAGKQVAFSIKNNGGANFAFFDGNAQTTHTYTISGGNEPGQWDFQAVNSQTSGTCNAFTLRAQNESPFNFLNQPPWAWITPSSPYSLTSKTLGGFVMG